MRSTATRHARFERAIAHGPERVWDAVTDPTQLAAWSPAAVAYEQRVGAPMQFDFGGEQGLDVYPGEVLEFDPPRGRVRLGRGHLALRAGRNT